MTTDAAATVVKPGLQTSEFWTHLLTVVVSAGTVAATAVHPGFKVPALVSELTAPAAVLAAVVSQVVYTLSRFGLKKAALPALEAVAKSNAVSLEDVNTQVGVALASDSRLKGLESVNLRIQAAVKDAVGPLGDDLKAIKQLFGQAVAVPAAPAADPVPASGSSNVDLSDLAPAPAEVNPNSNGMAVPSQSDPNAITSVVASGTAGV